MQIKTLSNYLVGAILTASMLAGCTAGSSGVVPAAAASGDRPEPVFSTEVTPVAQMQALHATSCPCLYVANRGSQLGSTLDSVTVYAAGARGHAAPLRIISGSNTGLNRPWGPALDSAGNLYVSNSLASSLTVYAAGANGNVAPSRTISGSATGLIEPAGIALDPSDNIYVANYSGSTVTVYASGANGNVAPVRTIAGSATNLNTPEGIALDSDLNIYVANSHNNSVTVFAAGANGNATPIQTISGSATELNGPTGIALDGQRNIYVANYGQQFGGVTRVNVYAAGANGNVAPIRTITGTRTRLDAPYGLARDASGNILVANEALIPMVNTFAAGAHGNARPIRALRGRRTQLKLPVGIAIQ